MPGPGFKIGDAFQFAEARGLAADVERIRLISVHAAAGKRSVVQKGHFVELFESRGLMDDFVREHWPLRNNALGERRRATYLDKKALNDRLLSGEPPDEDADRPIEEASRQEGSQLPSDATFALEAQLRDFIAANLTRLRPVAQRLRLYVDAAGRDGVEYPTDVGPIDILAVDEDGNFFVFELKLERGPDRALGQLARYMGWVKVNLASEKLVSGVVVAQAINQKLRYAVCVVPNVTLLEYEVSFKLNPVGSIETA